MPLLKKGDHLIPQNYRPVALLPVLSKILEKAVFMQIMDYLDANKLLHPNHHGSRPYHNTCTALLDMYCSWIDSYEKDEVTGVMMLDLSAAFDLVNHNLLIQKLELMGFSKEVLDWFISYLSDRYQCVYVDGQFSDLKVMTVGVPQGSVLGAFCSSSGLILRVTGRLHHRKNEMKTLSYIKYILMYNTNTI